MTEAVALQINTEKCESKTWIIWFPIPTVRKLVLQQIKLWNEAKTRKPKSCERYHTLDCGAEVNEIKTQHTEL